MDGDSVWIVALVICFTAAGGALSAWATHRERTILDRWAAANACRIVEMQSRVWRKGPYSFRSSEARWVFRLTVIDAAGHRRAG